MHDDMRDFAEFIAARAKGLAPAQAIPSEEENAFNATVGLRIRCGVCGAMHRSSRVNVLPSLKTCIAKIVNAFKREEKSYYCAEKLYPRWSDDRTAMILHYGVKNYIRYLIPNNLLWHVTHEAFLRRVHDMVQRVDEIFVREISGDVPMSEILGVPNPIEYVRLKLREFNERTVKDQRESNEKQLEMAGQIGEDLLNWRELPIERWEVRKQEACKQDQDYDNASSAPKVIESVEINGKRFGCESLLNHFETPNLYGTLWIEKPRRIRAYVLDVNLYKGVPALLWSVRARCRPECGITLLSTWTGKHYLVHRIARLISGINNMDVLSEIIPVKANS